MVIRFNHCGLLHLVDSTRTNTDLGDEYVNHLYSLLSDHHVFERASALESFYKNTFPDLFDTNESADLSQSQRPAQYEAIRHSICSPSLHRYTPTTLHEAITLAEAIDRDVTGLMIASEKTQAT